MKIMYFVDRKNKTQRPCKRSFIFQLRAVKFGAQADRVENTCRRVNKYLLLVNKLQMLRRCAALKVYPLHLTGAEIFVYYYYIYYIYLFSSLHNVSTSSCADLKIILSSSSSCLCHSSLLPLIHFHPSVL